MGYQCLVCKEKYTGPGSKIKAETCASHLIPNPKLTLHRKYKVSLENCNLFAIEVTEIEIHPTFNLLGGYPTDHELSYKVVPFAVYKSKSLFEGKHWYRCFGSITINSVQASTCFPWDEETIIQI
ncbi:hypothetical protein A2V49_04155 [candidate division WWE3 bacterium RBG_19FT_COMBO_34_6]|uniref:Uncharacterized protein n=1 Tax=candidate division WWE3 bacterium RBG_19FT_COMBO_34_6 TaxID=1802612 RepID=A0A1F4ULN0_UNCKA|nr:MAG: hypothetical protein A2V49_04155 [candidate division WWE3 bacterium RBG_19FT_COMBO_34_6]